VPGGAGQDGGGQVEQGSLPVLSDAALGQSGSDGAVGKVSGDGAGIDVLGALGPGQRLVGLAEGGLAAQVEVPGVRDAGELSLVVLLAGARPVVAGAAKGETALLEPGGLEQFAERPDRMPERSRV
jgi:hypothetical protein